jgi:hypothetical protein
MMLEKDLTALIREVLETNNGCSPEELAAAIVGAGWRNPTKPNRQRGSAEQEQLKKDLLSEIKAGTFVSAKGNYQKDLALRSLKRHGLIANTGSTRNPNWVAL